MIIKLVFWKINVTFRVRGLFFQLALILSATYAAFGSDVCMQDNVQLCYIYDMIFIAQFLKSNKLL